MLTRLEGRRRSHRCFSERILLVTYLRETCFDFCYRIVVALIQAAMGGQADRQLQEAKLNGADCTCLSRRSS